MLIISVLLMISLWTENFYQVNDSMKQFFSMLGKVNSPPSRWHCSGWDICLGGGRIVESCAYRCPHHFDRHQLYFMFSFRIFALQFPSFIFKPTFLKASDWNLTFHTTKWEWIPEMWPFCVPLPLRRVWLISLDQGSWNFLKPFWIGDGAMA